MNALQSWLQQPDDYAEGIRLLQQYSPKSPMLAILEAGPTRYNQRKLYELLQDLPAAPEEEKKVVPSFRKDISYRPRELQSLDEEWKPLYKRLSAMHGQLPYIRSREKRKEYCLAIARGFRDVIVPAWKARDAYLRHGITPDPPPPDPLLEVTPLTEAQHYAVRQLYNIPTRISKAKKKGDMNKIAELEAMLTRVKEKLGIHE